jgi:hypothetical protein
MSDNKPISLEELAKLYKLTEPPKPKGGGYAEFTDETEQWVRIVDGGGSVIMMPTEDYFDILKYNANKGDSNEQT